MKVLRVGREMSQRIQEGIVFPKNGKVLCEYCRGTLGGSLGAAWGQPEAAGTWGEREGEWLVVPLTPTP